MLQFRLLGMLFLPSISSVSVSLVVSALVLAISAWLYVTRNSVFNEYVFGPEGLVTTLQIAQHNPFGFLQSLLNLPYAYHGFIILVSAAIGLVVYIILQSISRVLSGGAITWLDIHTSDPDSQKALKQQYSLRASVRSLSCILWILFIFFSLKVFVPFAFLCIQVGIDSIQDIVSWSFIGLGYAILVVAFHINIIFLRLILLRPRLFGARDVIESALY